MLTSPHLRAIPSPPLPPLPTADALRRAARRGYLPTPDPSSFNYDSRTRAFGGQRGNVGSWPGIFFFRLPWRFLSFSLSRMCVHTRLEVQCRLVAVPTSVFNTSATVMGSLTDSLSLSLSVFLSLARARSLSLSRPFPPCLPPSPPSSLSPPSLPLFCLCEARRQQEDLNPHRFQTPFGRK